MVEKKSEHYQLHYNLMQHIVKICLRTPPVTFEGKFVDAYPDLYQRLRNSARGISFKCLGFYALKTFTMFNDDTFG